GQDTDYHLLTSMLAMSARVVSTQKTMSQQAISPVAPFVLILGDFLAHDFRKHYRMYSLDKSAVGYQKFVKKTFVFLMNQITNTFPTTNVYVVVGNNDSYRNNYVIDLKGPFFKDMATLGSALIKDKNSRIEMRQQFAAAGYYALDVPSVPGLRLI